MIKNREYKVGTLNLLEYENEWSMNGERRPSHIKPSYNYIATGYDNYGQKHSGRAGAEHFAIEHCQKAIDRANMYKGLPTLERFKFLRNNFERSRVSPDAVMEAIRALLDEAIERNKK